jgi:hypothetical protein
MLQRTPNTTITPTVTQKRPRQILAITGKALTMGSWTKHQLAYLAAHWLTGALILKPSLALASRTFYVSVPMIKAAIRELEAMTVAQHPIETMWANMSDAERDHFVDDHLGDLWVRFDRITAAA